MIINYDRNNSLRQPLSNGGVQTMDDDLAKVRLLVTAFLLPSKSQTVSSSHRSCRTGRLFLYSFYIIISVYISFSTLLIDFSQMSSTCSSRPSENTLVIRPPHVEANV